MRSRQPLFVLGTLAAAALACSRMRDEPPAVLQVPRLWDEEALRDWALPLARLGQPPSFESSASY